MTSPFNDGKNRDFTEEEDVLIWDFVMRNTYDPMTGTLKKLEVTQSLFKTMTGTDRRSFALLLRFKKLLTQNLKSPKLSEDDKLAIYWSLDVPISKNYMRELRKRYHLSVEGMFLKSYKRKTEKELKEKKEKKGTDQFVMQESHWEYMRNNNDLIHPFGKDNWECDEFWNEFCAEFELDDDSARIAKHFQEVIVPNFHKTEMDLRKKISIYCDLHIPIDKDYLEKLRKIAFVQVFDGCYIQKVILMKEESPDEPEEEEDRRDLTEAVSDVVKTEPMDVELDDFPIPPEKGRFDEEPCSEISAFKYLTALQELVTEMNVPELSSSQNEIEFAIQNVAKVENKMIPVNMIQKLIESLFPLPTN